MAAVQVPSWPVSELPFSAATKVDRIAFISGNQGSGVSLGVCRASFAMLEHRRMS